MRNRDNSSLECCENMHSPTSSPSRDKFHNLHLRMLMKKSSSLVVLGIVKHADSWCSDATFNDTWADKHVPKTNINFIWHVSLWFTLLILMLNVIRIDKRLNLHWSCDTCHLTENLAKKCRGLKWFCAICGPFESAMNANTSLCLKALLVCVSA